MKNIFKSTKVLAPVADVWTILSTVDGLQSFLAPKVVCELWPGGNFEVHFFPENEPGLRGAEGLKILSFLPDKMISFEWDAPPQFPEVRKQRTWVVIDLQSALGNETEVHLTHLGWREGKEWDDTYDYFTTAWDTVMERLYKRFVDGPYDWSEDDSKREKPAPLETGSPANL